MPDVIYDNWEAGQITIAPIFSPDQYAPVALVGQYFFYFIVYSFLGWVLEGTYNLYSKGNFRKEGFLKGPIKPMYGFAPLLLLFAKDQALSLPIFLLLALIIPSAVEYVSGWLLKSIFHKQWWDYTNMPYQLQGHICLRFSLYWWLLCSACIYVIQPLMLLLYRSIEGFWDLIVPAVAFLFIVDLIWTCWNRLRGESVLELGEG